MVKTACDFCSLDVLANDENKIDYAFKLSLSIDIAAVSNSESGGVGGVLPYMSYIGMCGPKWYVFFFSRFGHKYGIYFSLF